MGSSWKKWVLSQLVIVFVMDEKQLYRDLGMEEMQIKYFKK